MQAISQPQVNQYTRTQGHAKLVQTLATHYETSLERKLDPMLEIEVTGGATQGFLSRCSVQHGTPPHARTHVLTAQRCILQSNRT
jgi:aspartate/methionine/tyrosine aminotransferase